MGEYRVQGMDYYYTLQGWLKGVNQAYEDDPDITNLADYMAGKDVFAFNLGYFNSDYTPANALFTPTEERDQLWQRYSEMNSDNGLYNGNIAFMTTDLAQIGHENNDRTKGMQAMLYRYDQLNRIISARSLTDYQAGTGFQTRLSTPAAYDTDYSYDANGNLLTLQRFNETGTLQDDFTYSYYEGTNRLMQYLPLNQEDKVYNGAVTSNDILYRHITVMGNSYIPSGADVVLRATGTITLSPEFTTSGGNSFTALLEPDSLAMYQYDAIGNLIRDQYEGVHISWTPYGKVRQVRSRSDSLVVSFTYDAAGNRIAKKVVNQGAELTIVVTRYLRDASGNVQGIYEDSVMTEQPIYGSSRLGMYTGGKLSAHRNMGTKRYELTNHLGNVMTVITDNIGIDQDSAWASVVSTSDYYPFGLGMGGRSFSDSTYRYFNGKKKDQSGEFGLTHYDYGFRIYNPSIGKFLSVDPLASSYPFYFPYQFASNYPILAVDVDGLESDYLLNLQERFIEGLFRDKPNTPIGQSNAVTNTFLQKDNLVDPRDVARQFYNDPVGTGQKIIGGIKKGVRETKEDLLSGDPERMAHAAGRVTGTVAETIAPVPVIGKIFKIKISPKLKVPSGNVSKSLKRNFSVEDLNVKLKGTQKGRLDAGKVERFKMLMQNDMFDFISKKGKNGVSIDKKGTVHVGEGHHRIGAAIEIFEETGNVGPLEKLLNNAKQTFVESPPANSTLLPKK